MDERRTELIRAALGDEAHFTEHYARAARCSIGEAIVVLMRLRDAGEAVTGKGWAGMTWRKAGRSA